MYTCVDKKDKKIRICLLFEHKSTSEGRSVYGQIGGYLFGIQAEDIRQKRDRFTLTIPVLFYHGEKRWNVPPLREQYGDVPNSLSAYIPHFDMVYINLREMSDEAIRSIEDAMLLRNVLLVFKHIKASNFIKGNFKEIVIFADKSVENDLLDYLFDVTLFYIQVASPINTKDFMELTEALPTQYDQRAKKAYEQFIEMGIAKGIKEGIEMGIEKGIEQGMEKGMEKLLVSFIKKNPGQNDESVAELFDVPVTFVKKARTLAEAASQTGN